MNETEKKVLTGSLIAAVSLLSVSLGVAHADTDNGNRMHVSHHGKIHEHHHGSHQYKIHGSNHGSHQFKFYRGSHGSRQLKIDGRNHGSRQLKIDGRMRNSEHGSEIR